MTQTEDASDRLSAWLRARVGANARIEGLERVEFGHSAELLSATIVTEVNGAECCRDVVVRLRPPSPALLEPYDLARQFRIMQALRGSEVLVPPAPWYEPSPDVLGRPFLVMDRVPGTVYELAAPSATGGHVRRMCHDLVDQLAAIHRIDVATAGLADLDDGATHLTREVDRWAQDMNRVALAPLPALERLLAELRDAMPPPCPRVTLVHGDAKPGNFAFVGDRVSAVFDWELATLGDPLTDLGWLELMWMQPVGITSHPGACTFDELLARWSGHTAIVPAHREWYRALAAFKMSVICLIGAMLYVSGASRDERYATNALGISMLTRLGLGELGVTDELPDGPVLAR